MGAGYVGIGLISSGIAGAGQFYGIYKLSKSIYEEIY